jgi:hypothetical protein
MGAVIYWRFHYSKHPVICSRSFPRDRPMSNKNHDWLEIVENLEHISSSIAMIDCGQYFWNLLDQLEWKEN